MPTHGQLRRARALWRETGGAVDVQWSAFWDEGRGDLEALPRLTTPPVR
jgi:hypothetical protein